MEASWHVLACSYFRPLTHKSTVLRLLFDSGKATFLQKSYMLNIPGPFFSPFLSWLWGRRQETGMFVLTPWRLLLDVWYPNKPSDWTAERHFSQGSWENQWYALLTQTLSQAGMKRMERGMEGWRYAGKKKCSVSAAHKAALAYLKNPHSPQRICSDTVNMLQTGPIPPTMAC